MGTDLTAAERRLVQLFADANIQIEENIIKAKIRGNSIKFQKSLQKKILQDFDVLVKKATEWTETEIPLIYKKSLTETNAFYTKAFKKAGAAVIDYPDAFTVIHREAINVLINKTSITLNTAIEGAGRRVKDHIRETGQKAIEEKLLTGSTVEKTKKLMVNELKSKGIKVIPRKDGTAMGLEPYSRLVARSTTREATNLASVNQVQEIGGDLVKMSEHSPTCPICLPLQGRVYSISGKSDKYPALGVAWEGEYANIHPNCAHVFSPYITDFLSEEEKKADLKKSNRPFDIDKLPSNEKKKAEASLRAYRKGQKKKAKRWREKRDYKNIKAAFPDIAPKSFSGYVQMKKAKSYKWDKLKEGIKSKSHIINEQNKNFIVSMDNGRKIRGFANFGDAASYQSLIKTKGYNAHISGTAKYQAEMKLNILKKPTGIIPNDLAVKTKLKPKLVKEITDAARAKAKGVAAKKNATKYSVGDLKKFKNTGTKDKYWLSYHDDAEKYLKALPDEQITAVERYTGSGYSRINDYLRRGETSNAAYLPSETKRHIMMLDRTLDGLPIMTEDAKVYRRVNRTKEMADNLFGSNREYLATIKGPVSDAEKTAALKQLAIGREFIETGYSSTSYGKFNWSGNIEIEIYIPKGSRVGGLIDPISSCRGEQEFLIRHGQKFQIIDAKVTTDRWGAAQTTLKVLTID